MIVALGKMGGMGGCLSHISMKFDVMGRRMRH